MFIRVKRIKKQEYAYLVKNMWIKGNVKQRVVKYLGKLMRTPSEHTCTFQEFHHIQNLSDYVERTSRLKILHDVKKWEIAAHGITSHRGQVYALHDGYVCEYTFRKLAQFQPGEDDRASGLQLAQLFVHAGFRIPQDLFVLYFQKLTKDI